VQVAIPHVPCDAARARRVARDALRVRERRDRALRMREAARARPRQRGTRDATLPRMGGSPVEVDIESPPRFERVRLVLRVAIALALGVLGITAGWLAFALYATLPVVAAIAISSWGADRFTREVAPRIWRVLAWLVQLSAFMLLLVDRFPTGEEHPVHARVTISGTPTTGSALLRLLTSIPSALALALIAMLSSVLWIVAAICVLLDRAIPHAILAYQRAVLRWQARLLAYHASLVPAYPPFAFDTGETERAAPASEPHAREA
jgi:hypothetical protein